MGSGDKHFLSFHLHHHHHHHQQHQEEEEVIMGKKDQHQHQHQQGMNSSSNIPKGCMAVMVGHEGGEQKRFVIPVIYIYHPLFMELLKEAEEEYGFHHRGGPINIPCDVQQFTNLQGFIKKDDFFYNHHHHHHIWCFKP